MKLAKEIPYLLEKYQTKQSTIAGLAIGDEPLKQIWEQLSSFGYVSLRGFSGGTDFLTIAIKQFGKQIPIAGVDIELTEEGSVNKLSPSEETISHYHHGMRDVPVHRENFFRGLPQPDLMMFMCTQPVSKGGETTVCDGAEIWNMFTNKTIEYLKNNRLVGHWYELGAKGMESNDDIGELSDPKEFDRYYVDSQESVSRLSKVCSGIEASFEIKPSGDVFHSQFAFNPGSSTTVFGKENVWCNSVSIYAILQNLKLKDPENFADLPNVGITSVNGEPIPEDILADIIRCEKAATKPYKWQTNDLVIMDNTRVMHGRTAFNDSSRRLYNAAVYLNF